MTRALTIALLLAGFATPALAQTEGRVSVGGSITFDKPTDSDLKSVVVAGPVVRLNPKKGWGAAGGFNWFRAEIENPSGAGGDFASLRVRPIMAGVSYTIGEQPVLISFSFVLGPSFNKIEFEDEFLDSLTPAARNNVSFDVENSIAYRPGVGVTFTVAPRVAIVGFGGYFINRPDIVYRDPSGQELRNRWKADAVVLSVGAVYSIF